MNIIEAAEAAKAGKRVELCSNEAGWDGDCLKWKLTNEIVAITRFTLSNGWRIILPEPSKLYPFSKALEMMKQGKWMKSNYSGRVIAIHSWLWQQRTHDSGYAKIIEPLFSVPEIEGQWQEVAE